MEEKISAAIKSAIEGAPDRKFVESVDFAFTIKDVDLKNPNNRIQEDYLRILRFFRFHAQFADLVVDFERDALDAIKDNQNGLKVLSKEIQSYSNVECSYIIEHGSKLDVVKRLIDEDQTISLLVLASSKRDKNPGVLVETISGDGYSIPVVVLPGNLNDDSIDKLSGYRN